MAGQRNQDSVIQAFHAWERSDRTLRRGVEGPEINSLVHYIPLSEVEKYMKEKNGAEELLKALYPNRDDDAPAPDDVMRYYLRPFAILISIGYGDWIHLFTRKVNLRDEKLPLDSRPQDFPGSTGDSVWNSFFKRQWKFYPQTLHLNMDIKLHPKDILPLQLGNEISRGGTSHIRKFVLNSEYDQLIPSSTTRSVGEASSDANRAPLRHPKTYVLKCLRGQEAEQYYRTEKSAYKKLKLNRQLSEHFLCLYGSFWCESKYYLIFDFADKGTLEDYMATHDPPKKGRDILDFWKQVLTLLKGLYMIHNVTTNDDDPQVVLGWHQDLRPQNILLRGRGKGSLFDFDFLIVDFGLSHFRRRGQGNGNALDTDTGGTHMYGAPETFRYSDIETLPLQVGQKVDVWSLGCILSEVATWVVHDWQRVQEYRRQRQMQAEEILRYNAGEIFHDARNVLPAVEESHTGVIKSKRSDDVITEKVLQDLVAKMLLKKDDRQDVHTLLRQSTNIVNAAESGLQDAITGEDPIERLSTSMENLRGPARFSSFRDNNLSQDPSVASSYAPSLSPNQPAIGCEEELPIQWSLDNALVWKRSKSKLKKLELPHKETLKQLQFMRHVFLIDNTATMANHRDKLEKIVEVLGYVAKRKTPDGIYMFFTTSDEEVIDSKKTKTLLKCLEKAQFRGKCNMALCLDRHLSEFEKYRLLHNRILSSTSYQKPDKRLNVYVLTDGLWDSRVVEYNIKQRVRLLYTHAVPQFHVGIQFIRFGNDPIAVRRLKRLQHLDRRYHLPLDIVDTTPANGCVLKMLLGGLEKKYDTIEVMTDH